ncbi:UNVERIFIED_CONTAM: hypothetical protein Sradi_7234600 [Sesamum radiatum]|uniref:Reverse transcriptase domain-containing protein n=1 Tax=Sesamum radiatum TaxID=300843 RepID=A0AAW2IMP0_SESRA
MYAVVTKLKALKPVFRRQRKQKGDLASNVQSAKLFLEKAQSLFDTHKEDILLQLVKLCQRIYCQAVQQELSMLKQRSKLNWLKDGDQCTRLFFRKINARRVRQRIYQINDESGVQLTDLSQIVAEFLSYFQQLLGGNRMQRNLDLSFLQPGLKHILSMDEANLLLTPVTQQEIKEAFFDINDDSAPGPDGYSSAFYKNAWPVIGMEVCSAVSEFFQSSKMLKQVNTTLLVLIPKVQLPSSVSDFRPIACCNVIYKAIAKILVRRMQQVLHLLIDSSQNAFVPGRSIADNVLLAQELLSGYNVSKMPLRCTIKVDIQKAYDSVCWDFLLEGLRIFNFPQQFIVWIDQCISTVAYSVNFNGGIHGFFKGSRGLRQGDPLSPYLFVIVMELWHVLLKLSVQNSDTFSYHWKLASRLTIEDCKPLLHKIDSRLAGWSHHSFSMAGRVQILKSVISSLHVYWSSVFLLPKAVINAIENRMRTFLWQGSSGRGIAKVSWAQICKPIAEGGLGFQRVLLMNQALMMKQLWRLLQRDTQSIWVAWVLQFRLRNTTLWTSNSASASWCWKKLIKLSNIMLPGLEFQGRWNWPSVTDFDIQEIVAGLPLIHPNQPDSIRWKSRDGKFSTAAALKMLQPPSAAVRFQWLGVNWRRDTTWASKRWRGKHLLNAAARTMLSSLVYNIWIERNRRRFSSIASTAEIVARKAIEDVKFRIMSASLPPSVQRSALYKIRGCFRGWALADLGSVLLISVDGPWQIPILFHFVGPCLS